MAGAASQPRSLNTSVRRCSTLAVTYERLGPAGARPATTSFAFVGADGSIVSAADRSGTGWTKSDSTTADSSVPAIDRG